LIDRPDDLVVDHISPRNTSDLAWQRDYFDPPDALVVPFFDATNGYTPSERVVPWIGKTEAEVSLTEELQLPGKTDPDEIWIEAPRRMYARHDLSRVAELVMGVLSNSRDGEVVRFAETLAVFDALPAPVRRALNEADWKWSPGQFVEFLDLGHAPEVVAEAITRLDRRRTLRARSAMLCGQSNEGSN
jgi:hypothetical protein